MAHEERSEEMPRSSSRKKKSAQPYRIAGADDKALLVGHRAALDASLQQQQQQRQPKKKIATSGSTTATVQQQQQQQQTQQPEQQKLGLGASAQPSDAAAVAVAATRDGSEKVETAGSKWFNMPAGERTVEVERDLHVLGMRNVLDRKRHYKQSALRQSGASKFFQIGTFVETERRGLGGGSTLEANAKKTTFVDDILRNEEVRREVKRKYVALQRNRAAGAKPGFKRNSKRR